MQLISGIGETSTQHHQRLVVIMKYHHDLEIKRDKLQLSGQKRGGVAS